MRTWWMLVVAGLTCAVAWGAAPTDNPVASYYRGPEGYPAWTDAIKWANVIDMSAYKNGRTNFEKFEAARDELAAKGGGVLYYPAGVYDFSEGPFDGPRGRGLMLKSGVVIRGEAPIEAIDPRNGKLPLKTRFVFGFTRRDDVAIDAGTRARFHLAGGLQFTPAAARSKPQTHDLALSIGVKDGTLGEDVVGYLSGYPDAKIVGTAKTEAKDGAQVVTIDLTLDDLAGIAGMKGTHVLTLTQEGSTFTGAFAGSIPNHDTKGSVIGRITTCTPETPRAWNIVGLHAEPDTRISAVKNVGICWVHLEGAAVWFGPDMGWGPTWRTAGAWQSKLVKDTWADRVPDGTHPMDVVCGATGGQPYVVGASGRLVFGCRLQDAAVLNEAMHGGRLSGKGVGPDHAKGFGPDGFYMAKFAPRIGAYGSRVFVAANVLPKSEGRSFKYRQTTVMGEARSGNDFAFGPVRKSIVLFDYNKLCGIDVNKDMVSLSGVDPATGRHEAYYEEGAVIRDNYVYNFGHKGYNVSGTWVSLLNNTNDRSFLKSGRDPNALYGWRLTLDGFVEAAPGGGGMVSDNLSRAFDLAGQALWIDGSRYHSTGSNPGIDGEGILCQAHGGTHVNSWAITRNTQRRGEGHGGYMAGYNVKTLGYFVAWNDTESSVGIHSIRENPIIDAAVIGNIGALEPKAEDPKWDLILKAPADPPTAPVDVKAEVRGDAVLVTWTDTSDRELAFRVDRSLDGGKTWGTIAYRPRRSQGTPENAQAWKDFTAPSGKPLVYRVVAVDEKDTNAGASAPTAAVTIPRP